MAGQFAVVAGQVATLFLMMGIGFVMGKVEWLSKLSVSELSFFLLYVVTPCVIVNALQIDFSVELLGRLGICALVLSLSYVILILVASLLFRREESSRRTVLQLGSLYGNVGFMGLPLVESIFGQEGLVYCVVAVVLFNILLWTHGATVMGGKISAKRILLNPGTIGMVAGMTLFVTSIHLPGPLMKTVEYMASLNTPLAMVVIGAQMSWADIRTTLKESVLYISSVIKLVIVPAITAVALLPFRLDPMLYCVTVVLAATPTAGATSIFAQRFERDAALAAQLVTLTTLLSAITLPVFSVLAQWLVT